MDSAIFKGDRAGVTILFVGAHPDDIELGAGGTIRRLVDEGYEVICYALSYGRSGEAQAQNAAAAVRMRPILGCAHWLRDLSLPDNQFDTVPLLRLAEMVEQLIAQHKSTIVYTHSAADLNIDHRLTHQAVLTACRPLPGATVKEIYAFEVPSSTEWGLGVFRPTMYVPLTAEQLDAKLAALRCYTTEMRDSPHPRSADVISAIAQVRGSQCGHMWAEAFETIRIIRSGTGSALPCLQRHGHRVGVGG